MTSNVITMAKESQDRPRILIVGEHPAVRSGNSMMLEGIMKQLDRDKYQATLFLLDTNAAMDSMWYYTYGEGKEIIGSYISSQAPGRDSWGPKKLLSLLENVNFHMVLFVGIDFWRYSSIEEELYKMSSDGLKWAHIMPYDLPYLSKIWSYSIERIQFPYVYSKWGYNILKDEIPKIKYFRPPNGNEFLYEEDQIPRRDKNILKSQFFPDLDPESLFVFGTIAPPQKRKNLLRQIQAFSRFLHNKKLINEINFRYGKEMSYVYYLHTEENPDVLNLKYIMNEWDLPEGSVRTKLPQSVVSKEMVPILMQTFDCLLNCSIQEGLSWTVLEAMILGIPVIASESTAHIELLDDIGILVAPHETEFIDFMTPFGVSQMEGKACASQSIEKAIEIMLMNPEEIEENKIKMKERAKEWIENISNVNDLIQEVLEAQADRNVEGSLI